MIETLITSSVLILCIVLLRRLSRGRIGAGIQYALWLIVAVRLIMPGVALVIPYVLPKSDLSIMNIANQMEEAAQDYMGQPILERPVSLSLPVGGLPFLGGTSSDGPTAVFLAGKLTWTWIDFLRRIWYLGMILTGSWMLFVNIRFLHGLRKNRRLFEKEDFKLRVYLVKELASPCLHGGVFRPAVYLPEDISEEEEKVRHVLAHEYCHYRHGDVLWAALRCVLMTVYWFHPLVWLAAVLSRQDCEFACDEAAIRMLGEEERISYGKTLVSLIARKTKASDIVCTATTMTAGAGGIRERIRRIAGRPRKLLIVLLFVIVASGAVVTFTFTQAKEYPEGTYLLTEENALTVTTDSFRVTFPEELAQKVYCRGQNDADVIVYHKNSDHEVGRFCKAPYAEGVQLVEEKGAVLLGQSADNSVSVTFHEFYMDPQESPEAEVNIEAEEWAAEKISGAGLDPIPAPKDVQWKIIDLSEPENGQREVAELSDENDAVDVYLPSERITTTAIPREEVCYLYISAEYADADEALREELAALDEEIRSILDSVTIFYVSVDDMEQILEILTENRCESVENGAKVSVIAESLPVPKGLSYSMLLLQKQDSVMTIQYQLETENLAELDSDIQFVTAVLAFAAIEDLQQCNLRANRKIQKGMETQELVESLSGYVEWSYERADIEALFGPLYPCSGKKEDLVDLYNRVLEYLKK